MAAIFWAWQCSPPIYLLIASDIQPPPILSIGIFLHRPSQSHYLWPLSDPHFALLALLLKIDWIDASCWRLPWFAVIYLGFALLFAGLPSSPASTADRSKHSAIKLAVTNLTCSNSHMFFCVTEFHRHTLYTSNHCIKCVVCQYIRFTWSLSVPESPRDWCILICTLPCFRLDRHFAVLVRLPNINGCVLGFSYVRLS